MNGEGDIELWDLDQDTLDWAERKAGAQRLGLVAQLRHYAMTGRFGDSVAAVPSDAAQYLAEQVNRPTADLDGYDWSGRSAQRHRAEILRRLAVRALSPRDIDTLTAWLEAEVCPRGESVETMIAAAYRRCLACGHRAPSRSTLERLVRSARRRFEDTLLNSLARALSPAAVDAMEAILDGDPGRRSGAAVMADRVSPRSKRIQVVLRWRACSVPPIA